VRFLRYQQLLIHELRADWSLQRMGSQSLLSELEVGHLAPWRAKVLGTYGHALLHGDSVRAALDTLAEAYQLVADRPGDHYNLGSARHSVAVPLANAMLFGPALRLLRSAYRVLRHRPLALAYAVLEEGQILGQWGLMLELLDDVRGADRRYAQAFSAVCHARDLGILHQDEDVLKYAKALGEFVHNRLRADPVDQHLLAAFVQSNSGRDTLLPRLGLASSLARAGDADGAYDQVEQVIDQAQRFGEPVPYWVACDWRAEILESQRGRTAETIRWRKAAVDEVAQIWRGRLSLFDHFAARRAVVRLTDEVEQAHQVLWEDALTGVGNRQLLDEVLNGPEADQRAIVFIDVDDFKTINDRCGHQAGDQVLRRIAQLAQILCRRDDVVTRFGGDEFVILLAGPSDPQSVADRLRATIAECDWTDLVGVVPVSVTTGTAEAGADALRLADQRMLAGKRTRVGSRATAVATVIHRWG
jgi:diguanylate cyclase (GGDEF)-like protein